MLWTNLLPTPVMAGLWANEFFPRWLQVLHVWLSHQPNYDEVTRWYQSWKAAFPPALVAHPAVTMQFNRYLGTASDHSWTRLLTAEPRFLCCCCPPAAWT